MRSIDRSKILTALGSIRLTIACLAFFMMLVMACTLAQGSLGLYEAVKIFIRSLFLYVRLGSVRLPILPGGALVGIVLLINLAAAQYQRFELSKRKFGMWLTHLGLIVLFLGEFATGLFQVETQMFLDQGAVVSHSESPRELELAVVDLSQPDADVVYALKESALAARRPLSHPALPFTADIVSYTRQKQGDNEMPAARADLALNGPQGRMDVSVVAAPNGGQTVAYGGKDFMIVLRPRRHYLPFEFTLKKFNRQMYPGTDIPSHFSSNIRLSDTARSEVRDLLISMNEPLRYRGLAFYQASFGKEDTMSVLQVVRNPGWLMPYISCILIIVGMCLHFAAKLSSSGVRP